MVLSEELRDFTSMTLDDDNWKRPLSGWSSRTTEIGRSNGSNASTALSGAQSLKSRFTLCLSAKGILGYLSQIKMGMDSRGFQCDPPNAEEYPTSLAEICNSKPNDKYVSNNVIYHMHLKGTCEEAGK